MYILTRNLRKLPGETDCLAGPLNTTCTYSYRGGGWGDGKLQSGRLHADLIRLKHGQIASAEASLSSAYYMILIIAKSMANNTSQLCDDPNWLPPSPGKIEVSEHPQMTDRFQKPTRVRANQ